MGLVVGFDRDVADRGHVMAADNARFDGVVDLVEGDDAGARDVDRHATGTAGGNAHGDAEGLDLHVIAGDGVVGGGRHVHFAAGIHLRAGNGCLQGVADAHVVGLGAGEQQVAEVDVAVAVDVEAAKRPQRREVRGARVLRDVRADRLGNRPVVVGRRGIVTRVCRFVGAGLRHVFEDAVVAGHQLVQPRQHRHAGMQVLEVDRAFAVPIEVEARPQGVVRVHQCAGHVDRHRAGAASGHRHRHQRGKDAGHVRRADGDRVVGGHVAAVLDAGLDGIAADVGRGHRAQRDVDRDATGAASSHTHRLAQGGDGIVGIGLDRHRTAHAFDRRVVDGRQQDAGHRVLGVGGRDRDVHRDAARSARSHADRTQFRQDVGAVFGADGDVVPGDHRAADDARLDGVVDLVECDHASARHVDRDASGAAGRNAHGDAKRLDFHLVAAVLGGRRHHNFTRRVDGRQTANGGLERAADAVAGVDDCDGDVHRQAGGAAGCHSGRDEDGGNVGYVRRADGDRTVGRVHSVDVAAAADAGFDRVGGGVGRHHAGHRDVDRRPGGAACRHAHSHADGIDLIVGRGIDRDFAARTVHRRVVDGGQQAAAHRVGAVGERGRHVDRHPSRTAGGDRNREQEGIDFSLVHCHDGHIVIGRDRAVTHDAGFDVAAHFIEGDDTGARHVDGHTASAAGCNAHRDADGRDARAVAGQGVVVGRRHRDCTAGVDGRRVNGGQQRAADTLVVRRAAGEQQIAIVDAAVVVDVEAGERPQRRQVSGTRVLRDVRADRLGDRPVVVVRRGVVRRRRAVGIDEAIGARQGHVFVNAVVACTQFIQPGQDGHAVVQVVGVLDAIAVPVKVGARRQGIAGVNEGRRHVHRHRARAPSGNANRCQHRKDVGHVLRPDRHGTVGRVVGIDDAAVRDAGLDRVADEVGRRHGAERHVDRHATCAAGRDAHRQPEGFDEVVGQRLDGHCACRRIHCGVVDGRRRTAADDVLGIDGSHADVDRDAPGASRGDGRCTQHGQDVGLVLRRDDDVAGCIDHAWVADQVVALDAGFDRTGQGVERKHACRCDLHRHAGPPTDGDRCGKGKCLDAVVRQRLHRHATGRAVDGRILDRRQCAADDDVGRFGHR